MTVLSYEEQRIQNIKDNQALLLSLGLADPTKPVKAKKAPKAAPQKPTSLARSLSKRKLADETFEPGADEPEDEDAIRTPRRKKANKGAASPALSTTSTSSRRSARTAGRAASYTHDALEKASVEANRSRNWLVAVGAESDGEYEEMDDDGRVLQRLAKKLGIRTQNPKTFGHIKGVEVGKWWASRMEASTDAIHAPTVAGISGNAEQGAWSVALSGGYPDDVDLGEAFTYTGSGGRDLKGTKQNPKNLRTAPQTSDQTFDNPMNAALKRSALTRKPVRVIRGYKLDSPWAPPEGYRYDGLYVVEKAWMAKGLTKGLKVCRYAFKRLDGQPPLLVRADEDE